MQKAHNGLFALHSAVFIFGLTALFSRIIEHNALDITLIRSFFACLVITLLIFSLKESVFLNTGKDYFIAIILGALLAAHWVTYFHAMQVSSIAVGVIALYTYPVITVFLEPLFHGEKPHIKDIISAGIVFLGIYLMVPAFDINDQASQDIIWGVIWGILSAFFFSFRNIIQTRYFSQYSSRHALFYQSLVVTLVLLPFSGSHISEITEWQWGQLLLLGIFFTALPHTLFAHSLRYLKAKTAGLIACLQVVYASLFAAFLLGESPDIWIISGGALVVSAAMYESFFNRAK